MKLFLHIALLLFLPAFTWATTCPCEPHRIEEGLVQDSARCQSAMADCVLGEKNAHRRRKYERQLIRFLNQAQPDPMAAATATWILGEVKSLKAIRTLVDHLAIHYLWNIDDIPYRKANPSDALIEIGEPSLLPLLKASKRYATPPLRQLIGNMYYLICGSKAAALGYLDTHSPKSFALEAEDIAHWINAVKE